MVLALPCFPLPWVWGGGFLIVPYMLLVVRLLAYYVPGTADLVVFITTLTGMLNYYKLGVNINWTFLFKEEKLS